MTRSLLSIVARALTIAHRVNRHCARPPARPPPFNTSCLRPSRPTLHLSPHTFSCTFHPPHTGILHPSASSLPHATSLHPHARNGIFAFSSARTQRSFCEHHFPTLPTTVALLPAAAIAASKAPSDAASSEASSSSPLGCGCSARAPLPPRASLLSSQQAPPHIRRRPRARPQVERGPPKQKGQAKANAAKARTEFTYASRPSSRFPPRFSAPPGPEKGPCPPGTSQFCPSLFLTLCLAVPTTTAATAFTVCPSSVKGAVPKAQAQAQAQARPPARARTTRSSFLLLARRRPRPPKTPPEPKLTTTKRLVLSITTTPPAASIRPPRQLPPPPLPTQLAKAPGKCPSDSAWRAILANQ